MNTKKLLITLIVGLSLIVMGLLGFIIYDEINGTNKQCDSNTNKESNVSKSVEVLEITDEKVKYIDDLLSIDVFFDENIDIVKVLFGGKDKVTVDDLNAEQKLFFAVRSYMADKKDVSGFKYCIDDEEYNEGLKDLKISKKDLEGLFVEDSSYLDNLSDEMIPLGEFQATSNDESLTVCNVIYGVEGPGSNNVSIEPVSAYKEGDKVVVSVKFIYEVMDHDYDDPNDVEHLRYNTYESFDKTGQIIETLDVYMNNNYSEDYDLSKYDTYDLTFKVVDGTYLFESIERK